MSFLGPEFLGFPPFGVVGTLYIRTYVGILCKIWQLLTGEFLLSKTYEILIVARNTVKYVLCTQLHTPGVSPSYATLCATLCS
jgi:hypothetical protein